MNRHSTVEPLDFFSNERSYVFGINFRSHDDGNARPGTLSQRPIDERRNPVAHFFKEVAAFNVAHHADYREPRSRTVGQTDLDLSSENVSVGKILVGEPSIHNRYFLAVLLISRIKPPALQQRNAHDRHEVVTHLFYSHIADLACRRRPACDCDRGAIEAAERSV